MNDFSHPAAEGNNGNVANVRFGKGKVAVGPHVGVCVDNALAVGPQHANAVVIGPGHEIFFIGFAFGTDLRETARVDDDVFNAFFTTVFYSLGNEFGRDDHVYHVDVVRCVQDGFIGLHPPDFIGFGVDGIYRSLETEFHEVADHAVTNGKFLGRGTNDGG